ncbi:MAG: hypothetical protein PVF05_12915 [Gemmatimonadales bacterium]|jgi:hypothetical protein
MSGRKPDRRYDDEEIGEIFALAAEARDAAPPAAGSRAGLTLEELQEVGREVGLLPDRVAAAAALVDADGGVGASTGARAPTRVERTVDLPRALTDREWEVLAGEMREVFDARGRVTTRPSAREWTDGEVHAVVGPTDGGQQLRLEARTAPITPAAVAGGLGLAAGALALVTGALDAATFGLVLEWLLPVLLMLVGAGALGLHVIRLRQWAEKRELDFEEVADRARELAARPEDVPRPDPR